MYDETQKDWHWALPGSIFVTLAVLAGYLYSKQVNQYWVLLVLGLAVIAFIGFGLNVFNKMVDQSTERFERRQAALANTPLVQLAEHMKAMHPEAVKVLNRFGVRTTWDVVFNHGERDWVLQGTNCHFGFIEYVLNRSSSTALYPKRLIGEGSKKWDPDGLILDRDQYDQFETWLFSRLMVTRSHGDYKPAEFLPPWNPFHIKQMMGMVGEQELYQPQDGPYKDLAQEPAKAPGPVVPQPDQKLAAERGELSDEDMARINNEMAAYKKSLQV